MMMNISQTYHSDRFVIYTNIKSLCYTPGANIMLYVNYILIKKIELGKDMQITNFEIHVINKV